LDLAIQFCLGAPVDSVVLPGPASQQEVEDGVESATSDIPNGIWEDFEAEFNISR
jgi:aryl-alcohol dehydrogenase-like predicted oxidoreductase